MNRRKRKLLRKNKLYSIMFVILGALTIPIENDTTIFVVTLFFAIMLFFSKENYIC